MAFGKQIVTRKAILIGAPGKGDDFLYGVKNDLLNMRKFLLSDKGGRWFENEIITLSDPTFNKVYEVVHSTVVDYNIIYFSGHGNTSALMERMLSLRDNLISDTFLLNNSSRQLIIIDACRNFVGTGISGVPDFGVTWDHIDGYYEARELLNNHIANSPEGRIILHATQAGKYSYDSSDGGYFTQALLNVSARIKAVDKLSIIYISKVLEYVPLVLQKHNNFQVPSITYQDGDLKVPFAIGIPKSKFVKEKVPAKTSSSGKWVGLSLLALILLGLASSNKK